jgi:hypothetical protein
VQAWLERSARPDAKLRLGELALAAGVPCLADAGGFDRHTFLCGQSGSGKTYSLGVMKPYDMAQTIQTALGRSRAQVKPESGASEAGMSRWAMMRPRLTSPAHRPARMLADSRPRHRLAISALDNRSRRHHYAQPQPSQAGGVPGPAHLLIGQGQHGPGPVQQHLASRGQPQPLASALQQRRAHDLLQPPNNAFLWLDVPG